MQPAIRYFDVAIERAAAAKRKTFDLTGPTQWLSGAEGRHKSDFEKKGGDTSGMSETERAWISDDIAGDLTKSYLSAVGKVAFEFLQNGMPRGVTLDRKSFTTLLDYPHLGYCHMASVPYGKPGGKKAVIRIHYANFVAKIDTTPGAEFFTLKNYERSQMFFGIAMSLDAEGRMVVDRSIHHDGVSFIAFDEEKALEMVLLLKTGVSRKEWETIGAQAKSGKITREKASELAKALAKSRGV